MKHIRKKFFFQREEKDFKPDLAKFEEIILNKESNHDYLKDKNGSYTLIQTAENFLIGGFVHKVNGKNYVFPIPDPTLVYFNHAQNSIKVIQSQKMRLLQKVDLTSKLSEPAINEIYAFFGVSSGYIIFLFASIESFINSLIPANYIFTKESKSKTETFNQSQIQEFLDFNTKITKVLTDITKKDFFRNQTRSTQMIWKLKDFRDSIIHTKQDPDQKSYFNLLKNALDFKYDDTLESVAIFMNFYKKDYIIECDCGSDI